MFDSHTHCRFSMDSMADPEENIQFALQKGIEVLTFTDHIDRFFGNHPLDYTFNVEEYFSTLFSLKEKYKEEIKILMGVEIGLGPDISQWMDTFIEETPFDFVIGSIHALDGLDISLHQEDLEENTLSWYENYYTTMLECVRKTKNFHVLGHIDYIDRYMKNPDKIPPYEQFASIIDEILKEIIRTGRGIEMNTAGIRRNLGYANPKDRILQRYLELGGTIITTGSDSHFSKHIGSDIDLAWNHLKEMGFEEIFYFENKTLYKRNITNFTL
ncbi:histidinol-phosphatase HisJ family protein [Peptoniphilus sp. KCTC 25270]|uniref:histidinol-phosphatase HisJ family protein n=1 Tax=Peptoniphilus sp. KCTC 25270 TaxID=2897414 RepID=UPI001E2F6CA8|nr:histidinol-phosphatase HisJ family protein [Peptoniphilus sp. KCTC 25270]MCD1146701.1 histidinol-phosphatase HisJ family protein [Peptoniphilus sp. KCTC 25270]